LKQPQSALPGPVLLVDDQPPILFVAATYLEILGISCDVARNGAEALEKVVHGEYALVLIDVQMPVMGGLEATRRIRAWEQAAKLPQVPIIGMTAFTFPGDRQACLDVGMDDFIAKPFEPAELKSKILSFIAPNGLQT